MSLSWGGSGRITSPPNHGHRLPPRRAGLPALAGQSQLVQVPAGLIVQGQGQQLAGEKVFAPTDEKFWTLKSLVWPGFPSFFHYCAYVKKLGKYRRPRPYRPGGGRAVIPRNRHP